MDNQKPTIAIFDLDGTITNKDTYLEFIKFSVGQLKYYLGLAMLSPTIINFYLGGITNTQLKEKFFTYFFKGKTTTHLNAKGDAFSEFELPKLCRPSALKILKWHRDRQHHILILSASADIWLKKWCDLNGYELICSRFEVVHEIYTGKLSGNNCFGEEKKIILKDYFSKNDYSKSFGYGDSKADKYFLELVDHPYLMELTADNVADNWVHDL